MESLSVCCFWSYGVLSAQDFLSETTNTDVHLPYLEHVFFTPANFKTSSVGIAVMDA